MSKTKKFIPDLRIRRPYKREPKRKQIPPYLPFDIFDEEEDTQVDEVLDEEAFNRRHRDSSI
jgi:hypothetical protein